MRKRPSTQYLRQAPGMNTAFKNIVKRDEDVQAAVAEGKGALADEVTHLLLAAARKGCIALPSSSPRRA